MSFYKMSSEVLSVLKSCEELKGVFIIKAFPYTDKPARLTKNVIAVMPCEIETNSVSIGSAEQSGSLTVTVQIYAPVKAGIAYQRRLKIPLTLLCCLTRAAFRFRQ